MDHSFSVKGMTCQHCIDAVSDEIAAIAGVESVEVRLVPRKISTVNVGASRELETSEIAAALDEAGNYTLA